MKKYLLYIAVLALGLTSCGKDTDNNTTNQEQEEPQYVQFDITLPGGDPIIVSKAEIQTSREKAVDRLDIYMFNSTTNLLEGVYNDVTMTSSATGYNVTISVEGTASRNFLFIANNVNNAVPVPAVIGTTTFNDVKSITTQAIASSSSFIEPYLLMTAELTGVVPNTPAGAVLLERIMARFDIRNYEPVLTLTSFEFKNTYDKANLFGTGSGFNKIDFAERNLPTAANLETDLIQYLDNTDHVQLKHIIYTYPAPKTLEPTVILRGYVTTSTGPRNVEYTIPLIPENTTDYLEVKRNYRYTIVLSRSISGTIGFEIIVNDWENEEFEYVLTTSAPAFSYTAAENNATFVNSTLAVDNSAFTYNMNIDPKKADWTVSYGPLGSATSTDFSQLGWLDATPGKSSTGTILNDKLSLNIQANTTGAPREIYIRVACKADPHKFSEFKVVQAN